MVINMNEQNRTGYFAKSLAGHDKDIIYVIIREEKEYVYVADGKYHTLNKPKKKNRKHIQSINEICSFMKEHPLEKLTDLEIKRAIKLYKTGNNV